MHIYNIANVSILTLLVLILIYDIVYKALFNDLNKILYNEL